MSEPTHLTATRLTTPLCYHGEGPVWADAWGGLRWVDMLAGDLLTLPAEALADGLPEPDQAFDESVVTRLHVGTPTGDAEEGEEPPVHAQWNPVAAFVRPRRTGGYVVGLERGYGLAAAAHEPPTEVIQLWDDPNLRMNEGGTDPWGGLFAGSMAYDRTPGAGSLLHIDAAGEVTTVLPSVSTSNGIEIAPDRSYAYYNDTGTRATDRFTVVDGTLSHRKIFTPAARLDSGGPASPDGLHIDAAGNVWIAMNKAGRVHQYAPTGELLTVVEVPARLTTAVTLGGPQLRTLFITTSRENLSDPEPDAGAVFAVEVDVPGRPVANYLG